MKKIPLTMLYVALMLYIYIYQIQPVFAYSGFTINYDINLLYLVVLMIITSLILLLAPQKIYLPSSILSWLMFNLVFVPSIFISYVSGIVTGEEHITLIITMCISMLILFLIPRFSIHKLIKVSLNKKVFSIVSLLLITICYLIIFVFYRPNISFLFSLTDISQLYDIRGDFRESASGAPTIARYLFAWTSKVFLPFMFIYGVANNKKTVIIFSLFTCILLFSATGLKSIILGPVVVFVFWYLLKYREANFSMLSFILVLVLIFSSLLHVVGFELFNYIIVRRVVITPGFLSGCYIDFFSNNEFTMLGYSIFSSFVEYSYEYSPSYIIGEYYFGRSEMSANANFIATAFAEFGVIGSIVFSLIVGVMFGIIDKISAYKSTVPEISALLLLPMWTLVDTSLPTALLTHGLGAVVLLLLLIPKRIFTQSKGCFEK
ncbi:O-antigen polymerase [Photobacterium sanguinicancri]|uniref:O-antigen polymerase n=1 Tax=Photobacterium sanguinicancri TaxID=875932 RepID=UPI003D0A7D6F